MTENQINTGSGDNVGRDKIVNNYFFGIIPITTETKAIFSLFSRVSSIAIYVFGFIALIVFLIGVLGDSREPIEDLNKVSFWVSFAGAQLFLDIIRAANRKSSIFRVILLSSILWGVFVLIPLSLMKLYYIGSPFAFLDKNLRVLVYPIERVNSCYGGDINIEDLIISELSKNGISKDFGITVKKLDKKDLQIDKSYVKEHTFGYNAHLGIWGTLIENCEDKSYTLNLSYIYCSSESDKTPFYFNESISFAFPKKIKKEYFQNISYFIKLTYSTYQLRNKKYSESLKSYLEVPNICSKPILEAKGLTAFRMIVGGNEKIGTKEYKEKLYLSLLLCREIEIVDNKFKNCKIDKSDNFSFFLEKTQELMEVMIKK